MKHLLMLLLSICILLAACSGNDDKKDKTTEKKNPSIEVKVNKSEDAKKKIKDAKQRGKKKGKEEPTSEAAFDTHRYNIARQCLLDASIINTSDCTAVQDSQEYSRAWNNLANEGYLCQNGHCFAPNEIETVTETPQQESTPTTEQPVQQDIQTEAPPVDQQPATDIPVIQEPQTEQPLPDVQP